VPDPFQNEAVEKLTQQDVVVSAPTGSGKTWIAEQAIAQALDSGRSAWYASPLKALSNAKYAEFSQIFGSSRVGILTGDRKENSQADLIVGTTEILRNQLYDAMYKGKDLRAGLVVLDEAHFLGDPDRGVVWEEVIIYLPVRVRLALLSATVENAGQISRWLEFVRGVPCATVFSQERPVPLYPLFLFPDGELAPLRHKGGLLGKIRHFVEKEEAARKKGPIQHLPPVTQVLSALEEAELLPAIFFLKSRADCDAALGMTSGARLKLEPENKQTLNQEVDSFLELFPFLKQHPQLHPLRTLQVAAHHAGHLPHWKMLVERLMQTGLLRAIFSTSTVAAGVNFPARTVVITQSDRFNGREFVELSATDALQMTGRAGRRGMDKIGFCLAVPGPFNDIPLLSALLHSNPEPIESQLSINFSMVLNLLLSHKPAEIKQLLGLSLATFQRLERSKGRLEEKQGPKKMMKTLTETLKDSQCPGPEEAVIRRRRLRQLSRQRRHLEQELDSTSQSQSLWGALTRGRVFMDMFGSLAAVLRREAQEKRLGVLAVSLTPDRRLRRGRPRLSFVTLEEVAGVFQEVIDLPLTGGGRILAQAAMDQIPDRPTPLSADERSALTGQETERIRNRLNIVNKELESLPCRDCVLSPSCQEAQSDLHQLMDKAENLLTRLRHESQSYWYDFVQRLEFLRAQGFVDPEGRLSEDGLWASKLRLDQPVLIAEAIRKNALPPQDPVLLAGLVALFVDDSEKGGTPPYISQRLRDGIMSLNMALDPMMAQLHQWGFSTPVMPAAAGAAVFAWALGAEFNEAVDLYGGAEGDLSQLIYRTADNLRQIISLRDSHPRLADTAGEANDLLLRPPVVVPT
jgi:superfamily II RNA helicase